MSRFLYIVPAVVAGILLLELLARLWLRHFEKYYLLLPGQRLKITLDPNFFHCLKSPVFHFINRDGERGGEVPRSRAGLYRVLVVGGSATACALPRAVAQAVAAVVLNGRASETNGADAYAGSRDVP